MSSTPMKRPKPKANSYAHSSPHPPPTSESSLNSILEPPQSLFPSKDDFLRLIAVFAIATFVTVGCNFLATSLRNRQPKPFCDSSVDSSDSLSGGYFLFLQSSVWLPRKNPCKILKFLILWFRAQNLLWACIVCYFFVYFFVFVG